MSNKGQKGYVTNSLFTSQENIVVIDKILILSTKFFLLLRL